MSYVKEVLDLKLMQYCSKKKDEGEESLMTFVYGLMATLISPEERI